MVGMVKMKEAEGERKKKWKTTAIYEYYCLCQMYKKNSKIS